MGYQTKYELKAGYAPHVTPEAVVKAFVIGNEEANFCLNEDGSSNQAGKWFEHEKDLLSMSTAHPHLIFSLNGWGEDSGDIWVKYFVAGKVQTEKAVLTLAGFDPSKLKDGGQ